MVAKAEDREVQQRRKEEADSIAAAVRQAEGGGNLRDIVATLWGRTQVLQGELTLAGEREEALRAALLTVMGKLRRAEEAASGAGPRVLNAEAAQRVAEDCARVAEAERDAARAEEAAACRREEALRRRLQAAEARLAALSTGAPSPVSRAERVEPVGQVTGAEVCLWVRQTRALSALRDVTAERWGRDDAAPLRRLVFSLQRQPAGSARAALAERAVELARALGGV